MNRDFPPKPSFESDEQPRTSWLPIVLVGIAAMFCLAIVALVVVLMIGFSGPILVVALMGLLVFGSLGLQYLVWGRWFERIYRDDTIDTDDVDRL